MDVRVKGKKKGCWRVLLLILFAKEVEEEEAAKANSIRRIAWPDLCYKERRPRVSAIGECWWWLEKCTRMDYYYSLIIFYSFIYVNLLELLNNQWICSVSSSWAWEMVTRTLCCNLLLLRNAMFIGKFFAYALGNKFYGNWVIFIHCNDLFSLWFVYQMLLIEKID